MQKNELLEKKLKEMVIRSHLSIQELEIQVEKLDRGYNQLYQELETSEEALQEHAQNKENYSEPIWEFLQNEKKEIEHKYQAAAEGVRDIKKLKKTFAERKSIQQHWIHVR